MPKVMVITANANPPRLQLAAEVREIRGAFREKSNFVVVHESEARVTDLIARLRDDRPEILHFAGHGRRDHKGICLSTAGDLSSALSNDALKTIFNNLQSKPRVVVLNACYSAEQADILAEVVDVVVGVNGEIGDEAARMFATSFYATLGSSYSVQAAFNLALVEVKASGFDPSFIKLQSNRNAKAEDIVFYAKPELMARFELSKRGKPICSDGRFSILLWLRGVEQTADSVTYQICDDTFDEPFWEVARAEDKEFLTDDFLSTGDVTLRATVWSKEGGQGIETTLVNSLRRHYVKRVSPAVQKAISILESH